SFTFRLVDPVPVGWRRIMAERFDALCVHVIEGGDAEAFPRLATELYLFECAHPNSARDKPAAFRLSARSTRGLSTDHDGNAVVFRARLQSRGDVGGVAKYRVVKAEIRSHIADHARSGIQSDADVERHVFAAVLVRLAFELLIELVARAPDRLRQDLVIAREVAQLVTNVVVEVAEACAAMLGDIRSGSAKMTSKPIATAPSSARLVMR